MYGGELTSLCYVCLGTMWLLPICSFQVLVNLNILAVIPEVHHFCHLASKHKLDKVRQIRNVIPELRKQASPYFVNNGEWRMGVLVYRSLLFPSRGPGHRAASTVAATTTQRDTELKLVRQAAEPLPVVPAAPLVVVAAAALVVVAVEGAPWHPSSRGLGTRALSQMGLISVVSFPAPVKPSGRDLSVQSISQHSRHVDWYRVKRQALFNPQRD